MKKNEISILRVGLMGALLALSGSLLLAGCDGGESDGLGGGGGNGGGGGESSDDGGSTGGTSGCDPTFAAGGGAGGEGGAAGIAIAGTYTDQFGGEYVIGAEEISSFGSVFHIVSFDDESGVAVTQNDAGNDYNAGLYSRFVWAFEGKALYLCQSPYDAADAEEAADAEMPDASDWDAGCGGFAWSRLSVPCE